MRNRIVLSALFIVCTVGIAAAQQTPTTPRPAGQSGPTGQAGQGGQPTSQGGARSGSSTSAAGKTSAADRSFITSAAQDGKAEVALATLAQSKASSDQVKQYATRLHDDHTNANTELMTIATQKDVSIPDLPAAKKSTEDKLGKLSGAQFDRAYMNQMVQDHRQAISLFTKASNSTDSDVKSFAQKTLPTLKSHLSDAEQIVKSLGSSSASSKGTATTGTARPGGTGRTGGTGSGGMGSGGSGSGGTGSGGTGSGGTGSGGTGSGGSGNGSGSGSGSGSGR